MNRTANLTAILNTPDIPSDYATLERIAEAVASSHPLRDICGGYARCCYCHNEWPSMDPDEFPHADECVWVMAKERES